MKYNNFSLVSQEEIYILLFLPNGMEIRLAKIVVGHFHFPTRLILHAKCLQCLFPMFDQLHIKVNMLCRYFRGFKNCKLSILLSFLDRTENKLITFFSDKMLLFFAFSFSKI